MLWYFREICCGCTLPRNEIFDRPRALGDKFHLLHWLAALGAVAFAAADISVARDRFVVSAFLNRAWGLPVYYSAQLLLAWSIT